MPEPFRRTSISLAAPALATFLLMLAPAGAQAQAPAGTQPGAQSERLTGAEATRQGMPPFSLFLAEMPATAMRLSKIIGTAVIGLDHHSIGKIDDVLLSREGKAEAVVVGAGGVLGMGGKDVAVPYDSVLWNTGDVTRAPGPSASLAPADAPPLPQGSSSERMPGAQVSSEALKASSDAATPEVNSGSGPVATGSTERATAPVVGSSGGPAQAMIRVTKSELDAAPAFRFDGRPER
jgi:sporulation protein YlmC with PRC-barrel domain